MLKKRFQQGFGIKKSINLFNMKTSKKLNILRATLSSIFIWTLGVFAYVSSFYVPIIENAEIQGNWALALALIPATAIGAHFYYKKGLRTKGLLLGTFMFGITILLDAAITVPVFILPVGGSYHDFFLDPIFWLIGLEYIALISFYCQIRQKAVLSDAGTNI